MTRRDTEHDEHPGARALRLHAAALPPVPDTYEDLNARRCAAQTTRYGTVLDRHGRQLCDVERHRPAHLPDTGRGPDSVQGHRALARPADRVACREIRRPD
jgi:hypothetical protein